MCSVLSLGESRSRACLRMSSGITVSMGHRLVSMLSMIQITMSSTLGVSTVKDTVYMVHRQLSMLAETPSTFRYRKMNPVQALLQKPKRETVMLLRVRALANSSTRPRFLSLSQRTRTLAPSHLTRSPKHKHSHRLFTITGIRCCWNLSPGQEPRRQVALSCEAARKDEEFEETQRP
ncbi:hypothetical protein PENSPDRAFT_249300 [Peniophora sp. CONT]|nr:hypothetical protein PENSPDRAFT_249300 [Peniophora sp. CONT]